MNSLTTLLILTLKSQPTKKTRKTSAYKKMLISFWIYLFLNKQTNKKGLTNNLSCFFLFHHEVQTNKHGSETQVSRQVSRYESRHLPTCPPPTPVRACWGERWRHSVHRYSPWRNIPRQLIDERVPDQGEPPSVNTCRVTFLEPLI